MASITHLLEHCRSHNRLFLALDRDGTLVPYAETPEKAVMLEQTREVLISLSKLPNIAVALVSARGNARLKEDIDVQKVILAGNYGMEIRLQNGQEWVAPGALKAVPELRQLQAELVSISKRFQGVILQDEYYSFCLHWHLVPLEQREALHQALEQLKPKLETVYIRDLPTSYEFLPNMPWSKSDALEIIASHLPKLEEDSLCLFIGDSEQDESAFEWANARGGSSVKVGPSNTQTKAQHSLEEPLDATLFLQQLLHERSIFAATTYREDEDQAERERKIEAVFSTLRDSYALSLSDKLKELQAIVETAQNRPEDLKILSEARLHVHRLKGTVGSYGFTEIGSVLQEIESALEKIENTITKNQSVTKYWLEAAPLIANRFAKAHHAAAAVEKGSQLR
jgi:trehalose 6-phosphate phosphatase